MDDGWSNIRMWLTGASIPHPREEGGPSGPRVPLSSPHPLSTPLPPPEPGSVCLRGVGYWAARGGALLSGQNHGDKLRGVLGGGFRGLVLSWRGLVAALGQRWGLRGGVVQVGPVACFAMRWRAASGGRGRWEGEREEGEAPRGGGCSEGGGRPGCRS